MNDITVNELLERQNKSEALNIVDVREPWEYEEANMGALSIPLGDLTERISEIEKFKDEELIVHCKSGGRSSNAKRYLESVGFTKVRNLLGGMGAYLQAK